MNTRHAPDSTSSRPGHPGRRRDPHVAERPATTPDPGHAGQPSAAMSASARAFLARFARTLAVLVLSMAALLLGWDPVLGTDWASSHPWLTATAATSGWVLAVAVWLRLRGWRRGPVHVVTWATPTVGLLPLIWLGWLTPDGLVLWGPVSTLFAVALAMAADPMGVDGADSRCRDAGHARRPSGGDAVAQSAPVGSGGNVDPPGGRNCASAESGERRFPAGLDRALQRRR